ncbi:pyroglutamyl-peptidase I [Anaerococcus sp. AGMB09787]|uniref:pyroglutamyl-peptidase I n=1 Tax=Anaerococcus sp. AGMB09787 TaxID=2922869 RepID=UPI001FAFA334|nr:pyroglutamyl-peptidase I [Anaerococcus sp. AGMB09787]
MKILVTGFDPFGGESINPAIEAVKNLPDKIKDADIVKLEIPTVRYMSLDKIKEKIEEVNPDVVLSIGQAGGRSAISIERVGINIDDFRIGDNEGNSPVDEKVYEDGNDAYLLSLPIKAMVENVRKHNIPAEISNTAGTFVCNHVAYGVAYFKDKYFPSLRTGFIHIPFLPEQVINKANMPSMDLEVITKGLVYAIEAIVDNDEDIKVSHGKIA